MDIVEKLAADCITGFTVGKRPLAYQPEKLQQRGVMTLRDAKARKGGARVEHFQCSKGKLKR